MHNKGNGGGGATLSMDNDDNDKANEQSPQAGMDANEGGQQQPYDCLALAWRETLTVTLTLTHCSAEE